MQQNLHRAGRKPDWHSAPERNIWQKLAATTHGIVTPGNVATTIGLGLVGNGLYDIRKGSYVRGIAKVIGGRSFDLVDGMLAEATDTKSPLGEAYDATVDKVEFAAAIAVLGEAIPTKAKLTMGTRDVAMWALTAIGRIRGVSTHPSKAGKHYTAGEWVATTSYLVGNALEETGQHKQASVFQFLGDTVLGVMTPNGIDGIKQLAHEALAPQTEANSL